MICTRETAQISSTRFPETFKTSTFRLYWACNPMFSRSTSARIADYWRVITSFRSVAIYLKKIKNTIIAGTHARVCNQTRKPGFTRKYTIITWFNSSRWLVVRISRLFPAPRTTANQFIDWQKEIYRKVNHRTVDRTACFRGDLHAIFEHTTHKTKYLNPPPQTDYVNFSLVTRNNPSTDVFDLFLTPWFFVDGI